MCYNFLMVETYNPGAVFAARAELNKNPRVVLTPEFAEKVNKVAGQLSNETRIATLFAPWDERIANLAIKNRDSYESPSADWVDFMQSINTSERIQILRLGRNLYRHHNCRTLGDLRDFSSRTSPGGGMGPQGMAFITIAYGKNEPKEAQSWPLGL
jgi:hypothetical protein